LNKFNSSFCLPQKAAKGVASGHHHLLKKVDENFCFAPSQFFCFNYPSLRRGRRAMFWVLLKTGFMSIAPENIAALHSPKVRFENRVQAQPAFEKN
jgi:hypothetical protein